MRNSSYSGTEHSEADAGGEFMAAYELDLSFLSDTWCVHSSFFSFALFRFVFALCLPISLQRQNDRQQLNVVARRVCRFLPAEDLAQVFAALNYSVPPWVIRTCNSELYAEVMAIKVPQSTAVANL